MKKQTIIYFGILIVFAVSCNKGGEIENPYDDYTTPKLYEEPILASLPSDNFGYLHATIFKPTCANSGCHDGAFEPDFRTIGSAYNNTVYHPVLTNNATNDFTYRIKPGDADMSLLHERLLVAIPNTSGIMPPIAGDSWISNKTSHIQGIKNWINNGAKDMYGNDPVVGNPNPIVVGMNVYNNGNTTTPKPRGNGVGVTPLIISRAQQDIWFSIYDDITPASGFTVNQVKISEKMFDFDTTVNGTMTLQTPITANDFSGSPAQFTHKLDFDASGYATGTFLFVRVYVQDGNHSFPAEIPSDGSTQQAIYLFTLLVI